jgi:hypothetical protein
MGTQTDIKVDRRRRQIASSYRKQGYRVIAPSDAAVLPAFLNDCHPDLIAEKEGDRVVIEVKPSRALKGANDLVELAERVAAEPGWRLELVTVHTEPDYSEFLAPDWLERMLRPSAPGTEMDRHCIYLGEVLAALIRGAASINHIRVRDKTALHLARELVYAGVLDQDILDRVTDAIDWQEQIMRLMPMVRSAAVQAAELEKLCRDLSAQARTPEGLHA